LFNRKRAYKKLARFSFFTNLKSPGILLILGLIVLIIFSMSIILPYAAPVNITSSSRQAKLGILMYSYFENANAPTSGTSVTVDTQTSIPASSGSYVLQSGSSAYIWTPQFSSSRTIPTGKLTLDLWAGPTPSIDGQASASYSASSGSVSLTTTDSNDVIYVTVSTSSTPTVTVSGGGLTWNLRGSKVNGVTGKVWTFYAVSSGPLSSASIKATLGSSQRFVIIAFGISGVNTTSPFDPNLSIVASSSGSSSTASVSLTTTSTNDLLIGALYVNYNPAVTAGSGFSTIATNLYSTYVTGAAESHSAAQSGVQNVAFSLSSSSWAWAIIGDAFVPATVALTLSVSAYTTTSAGVNSNTLFSNLNTNTLPTNGGQVATVFPVTSGNIPTQGYVKIMMTAPSSSDINVQWGIGKPTNAQIALTYG
jgi:hypothetical protein